MAILCYTLYFEKILMMNSVRKHIAITFAIVAFLVRNFAWFFSMIVVVVPISTFFIVNTVETPYWYRIASAIMLSILGIGVAAIFYFIGIFIGFLSKEITPKGSSLFKQYFSNNIGNIIQKNILLFSYDDNSPVYLSFA